MHTFTRLIVDCGTCQRLGMFGQSSEMRWYEGESNEHLKILILFISQFIEHKRYTMTSFFYVVSIAFHTSVPALRMSMDTPRKKIILAGPQPLVHRLLRLFVGPERPHELPSPLVHLLQWQTCITILNFHSSMNFDVFHPFTTKTRMTERCFSMVHVASGAALFTLLLRRRVAFLHRTTTYRPLFKPCISLLSTYKTIELGFEFLSHC
jgi:hypothetical protein